MSPCSPKRARRAFGRDADGAALVVFALLATVLLGFGGAAITYAQLLLRKGELQKSADLAVLAATQEIRLANVDDQRVISVARAAALAALDRGSTGRAQAAPTPRVLRNGDGQRAGVGMTLAETVASPLGWVVNQPTTTLIVEAEALLQGSGKICLLGLDPRLKGTVHLMKAAQITAPSCSLYSNSGDREGLISEDNATVAAALTCSVGGAKETKPGQSFKPAARTDCPVMADPLQGRPAPSYPGTCSGVREVRGTNKPPRPNPDGTTGKPGVLYDTGAGVDLSPGLYCDGLLVNGGAKVRLRPGIYVMRGPLIVDAASFTGQNVGLYFEGDRSSLLFDTDSSVSLTAPKDGEMADLLMFEQRQVSFPDQAPDGKTKGKLPLPPLGTPPLREYRIISDDAQVLLGTIYLPYGRLVIDSTKPVAAQSAYTVVVARLIELFDGPNLVLNTNYDGTDIPVPKGVGPVMGTANLTR